MSEEFPPLNEALSSDSSAVTGPTTSELRIEKKSKGRLRRLKFLLPIMAVLALLVWMFQTHYIPSKSMQPTLEPGDQVLTMRKWFAFPFGRSPKRGDIIVFAVPRDQTKLDDKGPIAFKRETSILEQEGVKIPIGQLREVKGEVLIKRVVGLPGERIQIMGTELIINGKTIKQSWLHAKRRKFNGNSNFAVEEPITLSGDELFVVGDNLDDSDDSRTWGPLLERNIIGRFVTVAWRRSTPPPEEVLH